MTVTENETGKVLFDADGKFLLGAFVLDKNTVGLVCGNTSPECLIEAFIANEVTREQLFERYPEFKLVYDLGKMLGYGKNKTITEFDGTPFIKTE